jgi:hypothetical protein
MVLYFVNIFHVCTKFYLLYYSKNYSVPLLQLLLIFVVRSLNSELSPKTH